MRRVISSPAMLDEALRLHAMGLRLVPLAGKGAIVKNWPDLHLGTKDIRSWSARGVNWGIITGEPLIVLDTDSEAAESWVNEKNIDSPVIVRSGGGGLHRYFQAPEHVEIRSKSAAHQVAGLDVKGWRSYIVAAGSVHPRTGARYEYLAGKQLRELHELPIFDPAWVRATRRPSSIPMRPDRIPAPASRRIRNVRGYIRRIPSVQGQGGDRACFTVACILAEAGLGLNEVLTELEAWNEECAVPIWSRDELERKARYAFERVLGRRGSPKESP